MEPPEIFTMPFFNNFITSPAPLLVSGYAKWKLNQTPDGNFAQFVSVKVTNWEQPSSAFEHQLTEQDKKFVESYLQDRLNAEYDLCEFLPTIFSNHE